jgi:acyl-CoA thioesterase-1
MKQKPRLVVLELGSNDGMRGVPLPSIEENLRAIIQRIRAGGAQVLLLGLRLPPSFGGEYADAFAALFERVAAAEQVPFVPFFHEGVAGVPELNLPDGIHPTEEGHKRIAQRLAPHLLALLAADAGS